MDMASRDARISCLSPPPPLPLLEIPLGRSLDLRLLAMRQALAGLQVPQQVTRAELAGCLLDGLQVGAFESFGHNLSLTRSAYRFGRRLVAIRQGLGGRRARQQHVLLQR